MTDWENVNESWKEITDIYEDLFQIPKNVINYVAVYDILLLCVSGKSNENIGNILNIDIKYVEKDCKEFLDHKGWKGDLDINPLFIYQCVFGNYCDFVGRCKTESKFMTEEQIRESFILCKKFKEMETEINDWYY